MIEITKELANELAKLKDVGYYGDFGAAIGDAQFVLHYIKKNEKVYLSHISEYSHNCPGGLLIRFIGEKIK